MKNCMLSAVLAWSSVASHAFTKDAPLPPREAPLRMTVPEGFKATLFAGEPDVVQPIAMCFDHRGRLWVAECRSYPKWHQDLTKGKDRILIFEDTDGDGVFDKRTVFADKLANVSGLQVGFGGVFVLATPHVLFIPDKNGDDVPDGPPEVLLDGFDIKAGHNVMSCLTWGPDGWLYGCHGILATVKIGRPGTPADKRVTMNCGVWRYHPTRKEVEVVAHGTTNPWGLDFDEHGQMFITNCVIGHLWHVVPGARFERMYGQDLNPHTYGLMKMCADHIHWGGGHWTSSRGNKPEHSDSGGGHAHVGCMIYLGDNFPDRYRNTVFMCNLHGNRINNDILEPKGSTYVARHGKDFMFANDPWFRGIALCYGPDGGVYVSDWTDTGECHNYKEVDQTNGRIYKIAYGKAKNPAERLGKNWDLSKLSDAELVKMQTNKNQWFARTARRLLQERATIGKLAKTTRPDLEKMAWDPKAWQHPPPIRLNALWTLHSTGGVEARTMAEMIKPYAPVPLRAWAVRLTFEKPGSFGEFEKDVVQMAFSEPSPVVRLEFASAVQRMNQATGGRVANWLIRRSEDEMDPYLPLMIWYGVEKQLTNYGAGGAYIGSPMPLIRTFVARHTAAHIENSRQWDDVLRTFLQDDEPVFHRDVLAGFVEALKDRRQIPMPSEWKNLYPVLVASPLVEVRDRALDLAVRFGDKRALATMRGIVVNPRESVTRRESALGTLLFQQKSDFVPVLQDLLGDNALRAAAIKGLAAFDDAKTPDLILKRYASLSDEEKTDAVHTLTSRPKYAQALLDAMDKKQVPRQDVSAFNARQIQALGNKEITDRLTKVWGAIRPAATDKAKLVTKYKTALTPANLKKANLTRGRLLYQKTCAACHRLFDDGGNIGPDLTGSQRANLDYVLENMLDPSAIVAKDYQVTVLTTQSGRVITGMVKLEDEKKLVVQTQNELLVVPTSDIDSRRPSLQSMMPDGQLDPLSMEEVRDLIAYLASPVQVPLPPTKK
jgi:putative membrane-bound dehydrogenase-like protein